MPIVNAFERFTLDRQTYEVQGGQCYRFLKHHGVFPAQYYMRETSDFPMPYEWEGPKTFLAGAIVGRDTSPECEFSVQCPDPRQL